MAVDLKERREIQKFVELLAFSTVSSFYPTAAVKYSKATSLEDVFDYLQRLVEEGELKLAWEVKCSNDELICARKILTVDEKEKAINKEVCCDICGNTFSVSIYNIFPVFKITPEYREIVREDFKKKQDLRSDKIKLREEVREAVQVVKREKISKSDSYGKMSPQIQVIVNNIQDSQLVMSGDGIMDRKDRSIHIGGNVGGNTNINAGDHVTQTNQIKSDESDKLFAELLKEVSEKANEGNKAQLEYFVNKLKEAYEKDDKQEGSTMVGFIQSALGNIGSLASIASLFGLTL